MGRCLKDVDLALRNRNLSKEDLLEICSHTSPSRTQWTNIVNNITSKNDSDQTDSMDRSPPTETRNYHNPITLNPLYPLNHPNTHAKGKPENESNCSNEKPKNKKKKKVNNKNNFRLIYLNRPKKTPPQWKNPPRLKILLYIPLFRSPPQQRPTQRMWHPTPRQENIQM